MYVTGLMRDEAGGSMRDEVYSQRHVTELSTQAFACPALLVNCYHMVMARLSSRDMTATPRVQIMAKCLGNVAPKKKMPANYFFFFRAKPWRKCRSEVLRLAKRTYYGVNISKKKKPPTHLVAFHVDASDGHETFCVNPNAAGPTTGSATGALMSGSHGIANTATPSP